MDCSNWSRSLDLNESIEKYKWPLRLDTENEQEHNFPSKAECKTERGNYPCLPDSSGWGGNTLYRMQQRNLAEKRGVGPRWTWGGKRGNRGLRRARIERGTIEIWGTTGKVESERREHGMLTGTRENRGITVEARHADNWRALGILTVRVMYEKVHRFVLLRHPRG